MKIVELQNVSSDRGFRYSKGYLRENKESPLRITASPTIQSTETDLMLYGARYGYIQEPCITMRKYTANNQ